MKQPSLEEVKEYFKNAELVKNRFGKEFEICEIVHGHCPNSFMNINKNDYNSDCATVWEEKEGYAKILTYKEPKEETFVMTKEQIKELKELALLCKTSSIVERITEWFPSAFVEDKKELILEAGKWYKNLNIGSLAYCKEILDKNSFYGYGFGSNNCGNEWFCMSDVEFTCNNWAEATPEEVKEALSKEAVKRGFKEGVFVHRPFWDDLNDCIIDKDNFPEGMDFYYNEKNDYLECYGFVVYSKGQWAEIIQTITKSEAEQKLNCKII